MPRYHLSLVWPHSGYAPPPDLSRPELRAAFDAGRASRVEAGDQREQIERFHALRKQGRHVMQAYAGAIRNPRQDGLTAETAPTIGTPTSMFMQTHIDAIYVLWAWRREGVRMRPAPMAAAAAVTRTLMRRRSWRAALGRT